MVEKEMKSTIKQIRKDFESQNLDYNKLKNLYLNYNAISDINEFIEKSKSLFPKLNCGLASLYIQDKLKKGKIVKGKYKDYSHTFLLLENNIIIDITADQYGGPKIYMNKLKSPWKL